MDLVGAAILDNLVILPEDHMKCLFFPAINVTVIPAGVEPIVTSITTNVTLIRV